MDEPPIQYVRTSDGYNLAYWDVATGRPVVLVPSQLNSMRQNWSRWALWFQPLADAYRLINYDSRGQGFSTRGLRPDLCIDDYVADLGLVFDHLRLDQAIVIAHGFGGHVASRFAAAHPERVTALVLATVTTTNRPWSNALWQGVAAENWDIFLRSLAPRSLSEADVAAWIAAAKEVTTHADYMRAMEVAAVSTIDDVLPLIQAPTLVLHPRNFWMVPEDEGPKVAGAISQARLVLLNSNGHDFLGDSAEFVAAVTSFIDSLPPDEDSPATRSAVRHARLSPRETEVLRLIASGRSNQQIADELVLSLRTVERHITNLYAKIGAHGKADATAYALRHGFG